MKTTFTQEWKDWITLNVNNGQNKDGLFKILLDEGYDFTAIVNEMSYLPSVPVEQLVNPFHAEAKRSNQQTQQQTQFVKISADETFFANAEKLDSEKVALHTIDNFLNADECQKLVQLIDSDQHSNNDDALLQDVNNRVERLIGMHESYAEGIQAYNVSSEQSLKQLKANLTLDNLSQYVVIFLNNTENTVIEYQLIDTQLPAKQGAALICNCRNTDGSINTFSQHNFISTASNSAYVLLKRFNNKSKLSKAPKRWVKEENEFVQNFTKIGFKKSKLPTSLFKKISNFYTENKEEVVEENVPGDFVFNKSKQSNSSVLIELPDELRHEIHDTLKPICETWCGKKLDPAYVYGVRIYLDGAVLKPHRDRVETHIIGVIMNIAQEVNEDWPLIIEDNYYRKHEIILEPGDVVFYESARLTHGRPIPFNGKSFANVFCHFLPSDYIPKKL